MIAVVLALVAATMAVVSSPQARGQAVPWLHVTMADAADRDVTVDIGGNAAARYSFNDFLPGAYTVSAHLVDAVSGDTVVAPVTSTFNVNLDGDGDGIVLFAIPFDQAGKTLSVVESVYAGTSATGTPLTVTDASGSSRDIVVSGGAVDHYIDTYAGSPGSGGTATDVLDYRGLKANTAYTVTSQLMDYATGTAVGGVTSNAMTSSATGSGRWRIAVPVPVDSAGMRLVVFLRIYEGDAATGTPVAIAEDLNDSSADFTVAQATVDQRLLYSSVIPGGTVTDRVSFTKLEPGTTYAVSVQPRNSSTAEAVGDPTTVEYTADATGEGSVEIQVATPRSAAGTTLTLEASVAKGATVVATDANTTVSVAPSSISTTARDRRDYDKQVMAGDVIRDRISYEGLPGGQTYTLVGQLMNFQDGTPLGAPVTQAVTSDPSGSGEWLMDLTVPATAAQNRAVVVFQKVYYGTDTSVAPVAEEADLNASDQQVTVVGILPSPTTTVTIPSTVGTTTTVPTTVPQTVVETSAPVSTRVTTAVVTSQVPVTVTREVTVTSDVTTVVPAVITSTGFVTSTVTSPLTVVTTVPTTRLTTIPTTVTTPVTLTSRVVETSTQTLTSTQTRTSVIPSTTVVTSTMSALDSGSLGSSGGEGSLGSSGGLGSGGAAGIAALSALAGFVAFAVTVMVQSPQLTAALSSFLPAGVAGIHPKGA